MSNKLRHYSQNTKQLENARDVVEHLKKNGFDVDDNTGQFKIDGVTQPDTIIDLALALTAPKSRTKPENKMKNFEGIAEKMSEINFPNYLITNATSRNSYKQVYDRSRAPNPFMKSW